MWCGTRAGPKPDRSEPVPYLPMIMGVSFPVLLLPVRWML
jgi:hypothetical protein